MRDRTLLAVALIAVSIGCADPGDPTISRWQLVHADSASVVIGLSVVDEAAVWASGDNGFVARTVDGGLTWQQFSVLDSVQRGFRDIHGFGSKEAVVLAIPRADRGSPNSGFFKTKDGGTTWFERYEHPAFISCMDFWEDGSGFAAGDFHEQEIPILRTEDRGETWQSVDPELIPDALENEGGYAASGTCAVAWTGGHGWYGTTHSRVFRTHDYGKTWDVADTPIADGIFSLVFTSDLTGFAFGQADSSSAVNVAGTTDGGATWTAIAGNVLDGQIYGAASIPGARATALVAVHPSGSAFSADAGKTWQPIRSRDLWTVAFAGINTGWSGGRGGIDIAVFSTK